MNELYRPVPGWEGLYEVSDQGNVKSMARWVRARDGKRLLPERVLSLRTRPDGYVQVVLYRKGKGTTLYVHALVLSAFKGKCPEGMECMHLNNKRSCNQLVNLKYGTRPENNQQKVEHGTVQRGERAPSAKLTWEKVHQIRAEIAGGRSCASIARELGMHRGSIENIKNQVTWVQSSVSSCSCSCQGSFEN